MEGSRSVFYEMPDMTEDQNNPTSSNSELEDSSLPYNLKEYDIIALDSITTTETVSNSSEAQVKSEASSKSSNMSFKQASLEVQKAVLSRISRNISIQLVQFVDCLRDSYFGTLQRFV